MHFLRQRDQRCHIRLISLPLRCESDKSEKKCIGGTGDRVWSCLHVTWIPIMTMCASVYENLRNLSSARRSTQDKCDIAPNQFESAENLTVHKLATVAVDVARDLPLRIKWMYGACMRERFTLYAFCAILPRIFHAHAVCVLFHYNFISLHLRFFGVRGHTKNLRCSHIRNVGMRANWLKWMESNQK